mgnify:CR=1 FL=1
MSLSESLQQAGLRIRVLALAYEDAAQLIRERGFEQWQAETLMPQCVNRWILEAGVAA